MKHEDPADRLARKAFAIIDEATNRRPPKGLWVGVILSLMVIGAFATAAAAGPPTKPKPEVWLTREVAAGDIIPHGWEPFGVRSSVTASMVNGNGHIETESWVVCRRRVR